MQDGQLQIYTGNGKGKTTAAVGLSVRAAGKGLRVYFAEFIKDMEYGEISILRNTENIDVKLYGTGNGCLIDRPLEDADTIAAKKALKEIENIMNSNEYDVIICDELNVTMALGILKEKDILDFMKKKPSDIELVITGRNTTDSQIQMADLVTEMREIKHYYTTKKLLARDGIER
ncbi:MAG TPA: cob(I)yrinic acid a,c-diamide adenosyltransferase [Anaerovoracaceae bacterium]|nr:cob(I)yrinic acid a,c-diamide adenosyltransferase [Anaerovoracaceae bacterium]